MWETVPVLDRLVAGATTMDEAINFHDGMINPVDAVRTGWDSLRAVMRSWGVFHRADLTQMVARTWFRSRAARQPHLSPRSRIFVRGSVQERCKSCVVRSSVRAIDVAHGPHDGRSRKSHASKQAHSFFACPFQRFTKLGTIGFSRPLRVFVATGAHVEVVPSFPQGQVAAMLGVCTARKVQSKVGGRCQC